MSPVHQARHIILHIYMSNFDKHFIAIFFINVIHFRLLLNSCESSFIKSVLLVLYIILFIKNCLDVFNHWFLIELL